MVMRQEAFSDKAFVHFKNLRGLHAAEHFARQPFKLRDVAGGAHQRRVARHFANDLLENEAAQRSQ